MSVPSPCVGRCAQRPDRPECSGCARSLDEISRWSRMSEAEQLAVWQRLGREPEPPAPLPPAN
ncbi:DUF1289 domain-containing protein [Chitinimonas taiwanensis]|uniref:DUF1289 domain-containing protein n=1 Tax=Chitinimonas taiwanensis TaxID=240412 RepID=UPI0035AE7413